MRRSIQSLRERASELAERDNLGAGETQELAELTNLLPRLADYDDNDMAVPVSELVAYAKELAKERGHLPTAASDDWPLEFIDWDAAAEDIAIGTFTLGHVVYRVV